MHVLQGVMPSFHYYSYRLVLVASTIMHIFRFSNSTTDFVLQCPACSVRKTFFMKWKLNHRYNANAEIKDILACLQTTYWWPCSLCIFLKLIEMSFEDLCSMMIQMLTGLLMVLHMQAYRSRGFQHLYGRKEMEVICNVKFLFTILKNPAVCEKELSQVKLMSCVPMIWEASLFPDLGNWKDAGMASIAIWT